MIIRGMRISKVLLGMGLLLGVWQVRAQVTDADKSIVPDNASAGTIAHLPPNDKGLSAMQSLIEGTATHLQFAANGEWEKALIFPSSGRTVSDLESWLSQAPQDVAVEVILETPQSLKQFVGVRLTSLSPSERNKYCVEALRFFDTPGRRTGSEFLSFIRSSLNQPSLFERAPQFLDLGVFNAWRSSGPVRFWSEGSAKSPEVSFQEALAANPRYGSVFANPLAIELWFPAPLPHWLGIMVSDQNADGHRINLDKALRICKAVNAIE